MTYFMWLENLLWVTLEIDGNLNKLNSDTIALHWVISKLEFDL